jgi:hypothetical protein
MEKKMATRLHKRVMVLDCNILRWLATRFKTTAMALVPDLSLNFLDYSLVPGLTHEN